MDKWKDAELEKMKVGGNQSAREFLRSQPDFRENWGFHEKWNSKAAAYLRDKITTMSEGRNWSPETSPARNWNPFSGSSMKSSYSYSAVKSNAMEDEFKLEKNDINYQRDDWFGQHRIGRDSGGYQGFGNTPVEQEKKSQQNEIIEGAVSSLSLGWSALSRGAASMAGYAKDLGQTATQKATEISGTLKDGSFINEMHTSVSSLASKAGEYGAKGWHYGQEIFSEKKPSSSFDQSEKSGLLVSGRSIEVSSGKNHQGHQLMRQESSEEWGWESQPEIKGFQDYDDDSEQFKELSPGTVAEDNSSSWHTFEPASGMSTVLDNSTKEKSQSSVERNFSSSGKIGGGTKKKTGEGKRKTDKKTSKKKDEDLLIDFGDGKSQDWNASWDDAAWDILNK